MTLPRRLLYAFVPTLALAILLASGSVHSEATFTVNSVATIITVQSTGDGAANASNCPGAGCRLRDALAAAADGDTIDFSVTRTITLNSGHCQMITDQ